MYEEKKRKRMISRKLSNNLHCHFHHLLPHPQDEKNQDPEIHRNYEILPLTSTNKRKRQSLPQTRLHFLSILSGFTDADEDAQVDWKTDSTHHNAPSLPTSIHSRAEPLGGEGRRKCSSVGKGKEKERASLGGGSRVGESRGSPSASGSGKKRKSVRIGS